MFLALLSARSMTALSFWFTWMATLCWAPAVGLLGLLWAACLVCASTGALIPTQPDTAAAAATTNARLLRRAMVIASSLDRPSEQGAANWGRIPRSPPVYAPDIAGPEPKSVKDVKASGRGTSPRGPAGGDLGEAAATQAGYLLADRRLTSCPEPMLPIRFNSPSEGRSDWPGARLGRACPPVRGHSARWRPGRSRPHCGG